MGNIKIKNIECSRLNINYMQERAGEFRPNIGSMDILTGQKRAEYLKGFASPGLKATIRFTEIGEENIVGCPYFMDGDSQSCEGQRDCYLKSL